MTGQAKMLMSPEDTGQDTKVDGGRGGITASESETIGVYVITQNFPLKDTPFLSKKKQIHRLF